MHSRIRSMFAAALGLALTCSLAHAQLLLSGYTTGSFVDLSEPNTTVSNAGDGSWATFHTGIAATGSTQSKIEFSNTTFTDVASGDPIQVGLFEITNGMTLIGSGAPTAQFNLGLELTSPVMQSVALTQITFHVDHTPNLPGAIPDTFSASFTQPTAMKIGDYLVQFHVNFDPAEFQVAENTMVQRGDITVSFTPVPEPATYAAWGAALLVGLVGYRRLRARSAASLPAAA
ncbi:choice-of-anchor K domain-containing protein [Opitutus terrae]|uniref:PEP-CTERM protein-sorting domain-containing protein n=1 Tax=Opitutus terrae (strain DSM 11246 / JCM 15787 / PB90-1) TaxID=452637 RepID=B1ZT89_OPITP|nr:hypothetical protein Oter_3264 [Opitutus terrae PB90-1]